MATETQLSAAKEVMDAVKTLNKALQNAGENGLFVELRTMSMTGSANERYVVGTIESRESIRPFP